MELALAIALGNGVGRAEIDHVERADRADIRHAAADDGAEAIVGGREHAAHQQVADFGRGQVDHAGQLAGIDQLLHRAAADAGGMEHETLEIVLAGRGDLLHGGRGDAEHGDADRRQSGARSRVCFAARSSSRAFTMPTSALAPLASTMREIEFSPCTSVTEYIMVMSAGPT